MERLRVDVEPAGAGRFVLRLAGELDRRAATRAADADGKPVDGQDADGRTTRAERRGLRDEV